MRLNELSDNPGARRPRKRVGRGAGSGLGKTSGKGHKGQKSRKGVAINGFEGGQMPINRRLPKRGFKNPFRREYDIVNLGTLQRAVEDGKFAAGDEIDHAKLLSAGLVGRAKDGIRLLAQGELNTKLSLKVAGASKAAIEGVEKAGGSVELLAPAKPASEGVDA